MKSLIHHLRRTGNELMVNTVGGVPWATNRYWAIAVPDTDHPIAKFLASYNLPVAPCVLDVHDTVTLRPNGTPPDIARLIKLPADRQPIAQRMLHGLPLYVQDNAWGRNWLALFDLPGGRIATINAGYLRRVESMCPGTWHAGPDPLGMLVRMSVQDPAPIALLMVVRCAISNHGAKEDK